MDDIDIVPAHTVKNTKGWMSKMEAENAAVENETKAAKVKKSKQEVAAERARTNEMWIKPFDFDGALVRTIKEHWNRIFVTIRLRDQMHGGKPFSLDAAKAMLKARGLADQIVPLPVDPEERAEAAATVQDEGLCGFARRAGKTGIWFPSFFIKAGLKENASALKITQDKHGTKGELHELIYVWAAGEMDAAERAWIRLGDEPDGIEQSVCHTTGPSGPRSSIKRNEYVLRKEISFEIVLTRDAVRRLTPDDMTRIMVHFSEHGLGANRSQGRGTFDIVSMKSA